MSSFVPKSKKSFLNAKGEKISLNDPVQAADKVGIVRFIGETAFAAGVWVGVQLDHSGGKNDGSVAGVRYFSCPPEHGLFAKAVVCSKVEESASSPSSGLAAPSFASVRKPKSLKSSSSSSDSSLPVPTFSSVRKPASSSSSSSSGVGSKLPTTQSVKKAPTGSGIPLHTQSVKKMSSASSGIPSTSSVKKLTTTSSVKKRQASSSSLPPVPLQTPKEEDEDEDEPTAKSKHDGENVEETKSSHSASASSPALSALPAPAMPPSPAKPLPHPKSPAPPSSSSSSSSRLSASFMSPEATQAQASLAQKQERRKQMQAAVSSDIGVKMKLDMSGAATADDEASQNAVMAAYVQASEKREKELRSKIGALESQLSEANGTVTSLRNSLKSVEKQIPELQDQITSQSQLLEMAQLDKQVAEASAEELSRQVTSLAEQLEMARLEEELAKETSALNLETMLASLPSDQAEQLKLATQNHQLTAALKQLRDLSLAERAKTARLVEALSEEKKEHKVTLAQLAEEKRKLDSAKRDIVEYKSALDEAHDVQQLLEQLSDKNVALADQLGQAQATVSALKDLLASCEDVEQGHQEFEAQLQKELAIKDSDFDIVKKQLQQRDTQVSELHNSARQFREHVKMLQDDNAVLRARSVDLSLSRSQASAVQRASAAQTRRLQGKFKALRTKALQAQLGRLDAVQAQKRVDFIAAYLPSNIAIDERALSLIQSLSRTRFKARLLLALLDEYYGAARGAAVVEQDQDHANHAGQVTAAVQAVGLSHQMSALAYRLCDLVFELLRALALLSDAVHHVSHAHYAHALSQPSPLPSCEALLDNLLALVAQDRLMEVTSPQTLSEAVEGVRTWVGTQFHDFVPQHALLSASAASSSSASASTSPSSPSSSSSSAFVEEYEHEEAVEAEGEIVSDESPTAIAASSSTPKRKLVKAREAVWAVVDVQQLYYQLLAGHVTLQMLGDLVSSHGQNPTANASTTPVPESEASSSSSSDPSTSSAATNALSSVLELLHQLEDKHSSSEYLAAQLARQAQIYHQHRQARDPHLRFSSPSSSSSASSSSSPSSVKAEAKLLRVSPLTRRARSILQHVNTRLAALWEQVEAMLLSRSSASPASSSAAAAASSSSTSPSSSSSSLSLSEAVQAASGQIPETVVQEIIALVQKEIQSSGEAKSSNSNNTAIINSNASSPLSVLLDDLSATLQELSRRLTLNVTNTTADTSPTSPLDSHHDEVDDTTVDPNDVVAYLHHATTTRRRLYQAANLSSALVEGERKLHERQQELFAAHKQARDDRAMIEVLQARAQMMQTRSEAATAQVMDLENRLAQVQEQDSALQKMKAEIEKLTQTNQELSKRVVKLTFDLQKAEAQLNSATGAVGVGAGAGASGPGSVHLKHLPNALAVSAELSMLHQTITLLRHQLAELRAKQDREALSLAKMRPLPMVKLGLQAPATSARHHVQASPASTSSSASSSLSLRVHPSGLRTEAENLAVTVQRTGVVPPLSQSVPTLRGLLSPHGSSAFSSATSSTSSKEETLQSLRSEFQTLSSRVRDFRCSPRLVDLTASASTPSSSATVSVAEEKEKEAAERKVKEQHDTAVFTPAAQFLRHRTQATQLHVASQRLAKRLSDIAPQPSPFVAAPSAQADVVAALRKQADSVKALGHLIGKVWLPPSSAPVETRQLLVQKQHLHQIHSVFLS